MAFLGGAALLAAIASCSSDETPPAGEQPGLDAGNDVQSADVQSGDSAVADVDVPDSNVDVDAGPKCKTSSCARAIAAGGAHTCVLLGDETVKCWGNNTYGELGVGTVNGANVTPSFSTQLVAVPNLTEVVAISAGGELNASGITCALRRSGEVRCWGSNNQGQLGGPTDASISPTGTTVATDAAAVAIDMGPRHGCLIDTGGALRCWGVNAYGERGNPALSPVLPLDASVTSVSAGLFFTCAVTANASAVCYGYNLYGQSNPYAIDGAAAAPNVIDAGGPVLGVSGNYHYACATLDGSASCWGANVNNQLGRPGNLAINLPASPSFPQGLSPTLVATGGVHACAIMSDRGVSCWGSNSRGQSGDFTGKATVTTPFGVGGIGNAAALALGYEHSCALTDDGDVYCWGSHGKGQLGPNVAPAQPDAGDGGDAGAPADAGGPDNLSHPDPIRVPL